ncbi:MAG: hypothetical protein AVDCRST_MAG49-862 [uncultured Thermomicrobiales bacterium]|uniref:Uncharacterized protein n=1 Tax=uncultured Thermomicrobiales bacterium TaxID=1645740 RepID=A0A6J4U5R7_9BACT|nr:MAG: hypothetical protein AVDCRST_MAG49-862 [uncultured Thermomicrobiales bacterium]
MVGREAVDGPGWPTGELRLGVERVGGRSALTAVYRSAPFHLGHPSRRGAGGDGVADVIVQQVGPGLFPGERLRTSLTVGPGAALTLRGQSATKVYPCPDPIGRPAEAVTVADVAAGGQLVLLPGEVIPYRDAAYCQATLVDVAPGARFAASEILTAGRAAMSEVDAYAVLDLRLRVGRGGRPVLVERTLLDPTTRPAVAPGRHGPWPCAGTLALVGFGAAGRRLGRSAAGDAVWWAGDGDDHVAVVRLLGETAQAVRAVIDRLLGEVLAGADSRRVEEAEGNLATRPWTLGG